MPHYDESFIHDDNQNQKRNKRSYHVHKHGTSPLSLLERTDVLQTLEERGTSVIKRNIRNIKDRGARARLPAGSKGPDIIIDHCPRMHYYDPDRYYDIRNNNVSLVPCKSLDNLTLRQVKKNKDKVIRSGGSLQSLVDEDRLQHYASPSGEEQEASRRGDGRSYYFAELRRRPQRRLSRGFTAPGVGVYRQITSEASTATKALHDSESSGDSGSGHRGSLRGANKLARRARSFKDDLLERISNLRSPQQHAPHLSSALRSHSPLSPKIRNMANKSTPVEEGEVTPAKELERLVKDVTFGLKHFSDVITKRKLEMLPDNGTLVFESIANIHKAIKPYFGRSPQLSSAGHRLCLSLATLIRLCDEISAAAARGDTDETSAPLQKAHVAAVVDGVTQAVAEVVKLAQQHMTTRPALSARPPTAARTTSQRNSLPDIPLTPKEIMQITGEGGVEGGVRASHSSESVLDAPDLPPPKPARPNRKIDLAPPLPPKRKSGNDICLPTVSIDRLSLSSGSLDSMLNVSNEDDNRISNNSANHDHSFTSVPNSDLVGICSCNNGLEGRTSLNSSGYDSHLNSTHTHSNHNRFSNESGFVSVTETHQLNTELTSEQSFTSTFSPHQYTIHADSNFDSTDCVTEVKSSRHMFESRMNLINANFVSTQHSKNIELASVTSGDNETPPELPAKVRTNRADFQQCFPNVQIRKNSECLVHGEQRPHTLADHHSPRPPPLPLKKKHNVPYLELAEPDEGYHGLIRENETLVEVTPAIRARGPLCSFLILNNKHHGEAPFEIMVVDENEARLRVRYPLNCEKRRNYKFDIAAVGCDGSYSNTVPVHITVTDVNEFAPQWEQAAYTQTAEGGRLHAAVLRVRATDRDCSPRYGDVCKYELLPQAQAQPFAIDNEGVIRNTEPLDYDVSHNHILSVVAYDCGMKPSAPVMVTIKVNKPCKAGWKGIAERVDYAPGSGPLALFPAARLELCQSDERCPGVTRVQAAVTLQASRAGSGCDRDTYSLHAQKTMCGMDSQTVDLLPSPGPGSEWAKSLKPDSGHDGEQMFEFDGESTSAIVPESVLPHMLSGTFTISTWMRHAAAPDADKHRKEHVLCLADDHKMNRHHYALFVRNCRLIFLLRRDFGEGDLNIFRPAEWRWKIPEVCDNEWHHYAVVVRFPNVELYVDGAPARLPDGKGPEVIDDWPLHPAKEINTTLVVGACWQGTESDMKHHLHGWLAGLGVWTHGAASTQALKCVSQCREGLSLAPDLYLKSVSVEGDGAADVETLLRKVSYGDARAYPTPGRRNVHVATTITCDNGRVMAGRPAESYLMVQQPQSPRVRISGAAEAARDYAHFRAGLPVFPDLQLRLTRDGDDDTNDIGSGRLDSCVVSVYPALNPDHESLALRDAASLPRRADMRAAVTRDGVILTGADSVQHYQEVLREIEYSNKKPAYYLNRVFKLTCSELNGRFTSNEYVQTLTVIHPHMAGELRPSGLADKADIAREETSSHSHGSHGGAGAAAGAGAGPRVFAAHAQRDEHSVEIPAPRVRDIHPHPPNHVALVIGAVALGAALLAAAAGAARARGRGRGLTQTRPSDMAWDDSALNITVNPMEQQAAPSCGVAGAAGVAGGLADSSEGESDDSDSDRHDSEDDDEEEVAPGKEHKYRNISQLEWDNSTM